MQEKQQKNHLNLSIKDKYLNSDRLIISYKGGFKMNTHVKVYEVMTSKPKTVSQDTKLIECAKKMKEHEIGSLIVKDGKMVVGIITEDDFVRKVVAGNMDIKNTPVKEVMVKDLVTIEPSDDIYIAIKKMAENGVKQLPVTEAGKLMGILTWKDVLTVQPQLFDVFIEKAHVSDETVEGRHIRGKCELCGCVKELHDVEGQLVCADCERGM
jgi:signal-transduction protein with cAMP-binding, CBS, and nucleotidyltransferase domain